MGILSCGVCPDGVVIGQSPVVAKVCRCGLQPTVDPIVFIEEQTPGYVRYRDVVTGRRWEVFGICDARGDCTIGATSSEPGPPEGRLDIPVTSEFTGCCPFTYRILDLVGGD